MKNSAPRYDEKVALCLEGSGCLTPPEINTAWLPKYISKNLGHHVCDFCIPLLNQAGYEWGTLAVTTAFSKKKNNQKVCFMWL